MINISPSKDVDLSGRRAHLGLGHVDEVLGNDDAMLRRNLLDTRENTQQLKRGIVEEELHIKILEEGQENNDMLNIIQ